MHLVMLVFKACSKRSRRKKHLFKVTYIHTTAHESEVIGLSKSIRILLCTIVAITINMLCRGKERELVLILLPEEVITEASAIDDMLGLLGNITLERLEVELVTPTAKFIGSVVLHVQSSELSRTIVCT